LELGILPKPDLLLSSGFFCDPPGAAMELLHTLYGVPVVHLDGNIDSPWGHWPKPWERQIRYFGHQIERMLSEIERIIGFEITEEDKRKGNRLNALLFYNHQRATQLVAQADPQPISQVCLGLGAWLYNTPLPGELQLRANDAISTLVDEVQEKVEKGEGVIEKGAPRVYFSIGVLTDPSVIHMVEKAGLNITNTFFQFFLPQYMYPTEYRGFGDKVAQSYQKGGPFCSVWGLIEFIKGYVEMCKLDGIIYSHAVSCKGYTIPALMIKKEIEAQCGIPVMVMEGDIYDSRNYSAEQMRTRVETFAEMLREMKCLISPISYT
jgi:benzoyl-CoA reductase/2-hydroxyglutaryl-CoA dehydratase subunit BcrC/BadD/HgdB